MKDKLCKISGFSKHLCDAVVKEGTVINMLTQVLFDCVRFKWNAMCITTKILYSNISHETQYAVPVPGALIILALTA